MGLPRFRIAISSVLKGEMKNTFITTIIILSSALSQLHADTYVSGYYRKDGTYVEPLHRTESDGNRFNNYSSQGNYNPYTGQTGHANTYPTPRPIYPSR
jgi:hypothetical protein